MSNYSRIITDLQRYLYGSNDLFASNGGCTYIDTGYVGFHFLQINQTYYVANC